MYSPVLRGERYFRHRTALTYTSTQQRDARVYARAEIDLARFDDPDGVSGIQFAFALKVVTLDLNRLGRFYE